MQATDFMDVEHHFSRLVETLSTQDLKTYNASKHVRVETGFRKRNFVVYEMRNGKNHCLDNIFIRDFNADDKDGTTTELVLGGTKQTIIVGYTPVKVFDYPVFVWLPLHGKLRWGATEGKIDEGSLGFPLCIRTKSRHNLREAGVIYFETGVSYGREFDSTFAG